MLNDHAVPEGVVGHGNVGQRRCAPVVAHGCPRIVVAGAGEGEREEGVSGVERRLCSVERRSWEVGCSCHCLR